MDKSELNWIRIVPLHRCYTVGNVFMCKCGAFIAKLRIWCHSSEMDFARNIMKFNSSRNPKIQHIFYVVATEMKKKKMHNQMLKMLLRAIVYVAQKHKNRKDTEHHWSQFSSEPRHTTQSHKLIKLLFIFIRIYLIVLFIVAFFWYALWAMMLATLVHIFMLIRVPVEYLHWTENPKPRNSNSTATLGIALLSWLDRRQESIQLMSNNAFDIWQCIFSLWICKERSARAYHSLSEF